ncbi:hypothetical protein ACIF8W_28720 [Streptomyces sp. NPDC085639]|uniref:hypothetical protein n=1 Tax=Streptomyces sp. NPDC085639 TaxID=3365734 RepID=UPI0037D33489
MGKKSPRPRRWFTPEYQAEIVEPCQRGDRPVDLTETAVREWVRPSQVNAGERDGLTSTEREELSALRREKTAGHNAKRARELLPVSRTAYYARRNGTPAPRGAGRRADRGSPPSTSCPAAPTVPRASMPSSSAKAPAAADDEWPA